MAYPSQNPLPAWCRGLLDGIPHPVALLDGQLRIIATNRALETLTGHEPGEIVGVPWNHALFSSVGNAPLQETVNGTEPELILEGDIIDRDRKKVSVRLTVSHHQGKEEDSAGAILFIENISRTTPVGEKTADDGLSSFGILGHCPRMQEVGELVSVLGRTDTSVLVTGETGTGKDLLAEAIHQASRRAPQPFIKVNCGALPESLLESELFGHTRGAFTGAHQDKPGMFRMAHGGTLYLTEIGDLPLPLQVKLLTVLDDREFYPLGSSKKVRVDVRLVAGTHRNLRELVRDGKFREDLYYRLNVLHLELPPLRDRGEDVSLLIDHFLQKYSKAFGKSLARFDDPTRALLLGYNYPGNVRELRNIVEYAVNVTPGPVIMRTSLPPYMLNTQPMPLPQRPDSVAPLVDTPVSAKTPHGAARWQDVERRMILEALELSGGRRGVAAEQLGWARSTLWRKIRQHGLE